jgi:hypothetical protein
MVLELEHRGGLVRNFVRYPVVMAMALVAACDTTSPTLLSDDELTQDVAVSAGDAIARSIKMMAENEGDAGVPGAFIQSDEANAITSDLEIHRTRKCFDANGVELAGCSPISSVRRIATHVTVDGSRSGSHETRRGTTATWSGAVHRVADDTLTRNFNGSTEVSRTHQGVATGRDTTTYEEADLSRLAAEAATDSVKGITWNLPRASNPWPVSGSVKRVVSVDVTITRGEDTQTRSFTRTVEVTFPADNQGNVTLTINDKTCQLNLVTHAVTNCQ